MIFWHVGGTILAFRYVFRDPDVDYRYLMLGSILPNMIDKPLGTLFFVDALGSGRVFAHSLLFSSVLMVGVLTFTRRGARRRKLMAVAIGSLFHLVLDGMWVVRETFLWPAFGWQFPPGPTPFWSELPERVLSDPLLLVQEFLGIVYLIYLWRAARLNDPELRADLWSSGAIQT